LISYAGTKSQAGAADEVSRNSGTIGYLTDINKKIDTYVVFYDDNPPDADTNGTALGVGGRFKF